MNTPLQQLSCRPDQSYTFQVGTFTDACPWSWSLGPGFFDSLIRLDEALAQEAGSSGLRLAIGFKLSATAKAKKLASRGGYPSAAFVHDILCSRLYPRSFTWGRPQLHNNVIPARCSKTSKKSCPLPPTCSNPYRNSAVGIWISISASSECAR